MAGIGFRLVKLLKQDNYQSVLHAYGLTAFIGAGPGLMILFGLGVVCFFTLFTVPRQETIHAFLSLIIYLFSGSMLASSFLQYTFFRFVADKVFLKEFSKITSNFNGVLLLQCILSTTIIVPVVVYLFPSMSLGLKVVLVANFILLSFIWISTVLLSGLKSYRRIVWAFILGYSAMIMLHFLFEKQQNDVVFLLLEFLIAQCILLVLLLHAILDFYPTDHLIGFAFLHKKNFYFSLVCANFFYTLGFWIDKYLFWFNPATSEVSFAPLRQSSMYDIPLFIAFLTTIPAVAVFMLHMEANFSMIYPQVMETIFKRKPLAEIDLVINQLVCAGRDALYSLLKTQACVIIMMFLLSSWLFTHVHLMPVSWHLLFVLIIGTSLNTLLWALLSILYYMTKYVQALYVSIVFCFVNFFFTLLSLHAGPWYFGYGYSISGLMASLLAMYLLNKNFKDLGYSIFMMTD